MRTYTYAEERHRQNVNAAMRRMRARKRAAGLLKKEIWVTKEQWILVEKLMQEFKEEPKQKA